MKWKDFRPAVSAEKRRKKQNRMEIAEWVVLFFMVVLAGIDLKTKQVPVLMVILLGVGCAIYRLWVGTGFWEMAAGAIPGALLLAIAVCSGESIGIGDGLVLFVLGVFCGASQAVAMLGMALFLVAVLAGVLLIIRRAGRKTELPFLPCLAGGYLLCVLG